MGTFEEVAPTVLARIKPSYSDVIRAKRVLVASLSQLPAQGAGRLVEAVVHSFGEKSNVERREEILDLSTGELPPASAPVFARRRAAWAAIEALSQLEVAGLIVQAVEAQERQSERWSQLLSEGILATIPTRVRGTGGAISLSLSLPHTWNEYRLSAFPAPDSPPWWLDPDLFTADLASLKLDDRVIRNIREALAAYRAELFLASCNLLGAAVEGAWYGVGRALSRKYPELGAYVMDRKTIKLQVRLTDLAAGLPRWSRDHVDELLTFAALRRELRNYGVHPGTSHKPGLERYFEPSATGVLILNASSHLSRLQDLLRSLKGRRTPK
jgi:hypothetical protein